MSSHLPENGSKYVESLARRQLDSYRQQPIDLVSHYNHEHNIADAYRGRQVLELVQNADDAGEGYSGERRLLIRLTESYLIVANTGKPFSDRGIRSLVVSDVSPKRLARQRYIGNKGLGFRSILTWTREPIVLSGQFSVAFSRAYAEAQTSVLAGGLEELASELAEWRTARGVVPAPIMRFPFVPEEADRWVTTGRQLQEEGYDTVIVLPLLPDAKRSAVYEDVQHQLGALTPETLLFCHNLEHVRIERGDVTTWRVLREDQPGEQVVLLQGNGAERLWRVRREHGSLPPDLVDHDLRDTPEYEVAVAIPELLDVRSGSNRLCVFFPTNARLPMRLITHATLATDDSRKHLIDHEANRHVLAKLASLVAKTAAEEARAGAAGRGLRLLSGAEKCEGELQDLGFLDALIASCAMESLFPRIDGTISTAEGAKRPPQQTWYEITEPIAFPEVVDPETAASTRSLLDSFALDWYGLRELRERLIARIRGLPRVDAGRMVGRLVAERALRSGDEVHVLVTADGRVAGFEERLLLPAAGRQVDLPTCVRGVAFLDSDFAEGLREALGGATIRDIRSRLVFLGYTVEEYRLETVARYLAAAAEAAEADMGALGVWRDALRYLYEIAADSESTEAIRTSVKVVTTDGKVRRADECYLGPAYPRSRSVVALYRALEEEAFAAAPSELGLSAAPAAVESFLLRLGVSDQPRKIKIDRPENVQGLERFTDRILSGIEYPTTFFGSTPMTEKEVRREFSISFDGLSLPDRWFEVLETAPPEAIVTYLLSDGRDHLMEGRVDGAILQATSGSQRNPRPYPAVPVIDPAHFALRNVSWVPCDDGVRRRPDRVILTRTGRRTLGSSFFNHLIDNTHPLLAGLGISGPAERVLGQLGAVHSFEALPADDLYRLLLDLPERDPEGKDAARIYRSLIESQGIATDSPLRERFHHEGRMWGMKDGTSGYYPVPQLRYVSRFSLPGPVRKQIPVVAVDPRRSSQEVERIFGVRALSEVDFSLQLDIDRTEFQLWSEQASRRVRRVLPYLYAYRLSRTADETSRERTALSRTELHICRRIGVLVSVLDWDSRPISIENDLDGLVLRDQKMALLVSHAERLPHSQVFWRSVGDLLADAIGVGGAASDFAQLLSCDSPDERHQLLDLMTDGQAAELLERAQERLEIEEPEEVPITHFDLPAPAATPGLNQEQSASEPANLPSQQPSQGGHGFDPVEPPGRGTSHRRRLVVAPSARPRTGNGTSGPRCSEVVTLTLAEAFELEQGRFPIRVEHLRGSESFGCDLISVGSKAVQDEALREKRIASGLVLRFIEVKGRSDRTSTVGLTANERDAADTQGERYFIYRVYRDAIAGGYELAILCDPTESPGESTRVTYEYSLRAGSGAEWYRVAEVLETVDPEPSTPSPPADAAAVPATMRV